MERHRCKLCSRNFSNGRALGGHMRSHMATLAIPKKKNQEEEEEKQDEEPHQGDELESASSTSTSSSSDEEQEDEKGLYYGLRENPKKSFRLADPEFSFAVDAGSVVQDRESETESSKNPSRRRSRRNPKSPVQDFSRQHEPVLKKLRWGKSTDSELEPVSSVSDTTTEEDVALCLMMLSRDIWKREEEDDDGGEAEAEKSIDETEESEELKFGRSRNRGKYQCGTCKKVFKSYQALGGHRASHKKIKGCNMSSSSPITRTYEAESKNPVNVGNGVDRRRIHECPVCFRIFASGQALGGHKRSHLSGSAIAANSAKIVDNLIDLNLPAPEDELSAVSDAEFVDPIK